MPRVQAFAIVGGAVLCVRALPVLAQSAAGTPGAVTAPAPAFSSPSGAPVQAIGPNFKLQPGDVLAVQVANHLEMSAASVVVAANGQLNLPVVGTVSAQGKTLGQVTALITRAYQSQLRKPQVSVTLVSSVPRQLIVRGAIARPGPLDVRNDLRLSEVIAGVGGLMSEGAPISGDEAVATLVRGNGKPRSLDVGTALSTPQSPANLVLKAGDVVNISARPQVRVAIAGDAVTPNIIKIRLSKTQTQVRVSDVLKVGGSLKSGKPEQTIGALVRGGKQTILNVPALFNGSDPNADLVLQNDDLLTFDVKEIKKIDVTVASFDGSVKTPGIYSFENDASALRTLVQAGGLAADVRPDQVMVSVQRGALTIPVDVESASRNPQLDVALENRDQIYVAFSPSVRVRLLGSLAKPDVYRLKPGATLLDAVSAAGGLVLPAPQTSIRIVRTQPDGKQIGLNADAGRLFGGMTDLSQNVKLQDADLIFVSEARRGSQIFVAGEVTTPGAIELGTGDGLAELLLKAGGAKPTAALSKLSITSRGGSQRFIDASALAKGGKIDIPLEEGDFVNVPRNEANVTVWGAVAKPDYYTIPENQALTIGNALILAGGPSSNAKLQEVAVFHRNNPKPDIVSVTVAKTGVMSLDYPLRNGDVVYVPEGKVKKSDLSTATGLLGIVGFGARVLSGF